MQLPPDLITKLHEKAAEQYGGLWFAVNQSFVEASIDQNGPGQLDKALLPRLAYIACRLAETEPKSTPNWFHQLSQFEFWRNTMIGYIELGEVKSAGAYARQAWHQAKIILNKTTEETNDATTKSDKRHSE